MFITYTPLVTAIVLLILSLVTNTDDFKSALVFKVTPFFLGVANLLIYLNIIGVVNL